ncbi:branched-chain amino acid ABC transporter permease [Bradyrhizobium sp. CSA207]|uniref:branched-chain amino acid ABC transporter permease n=1 Tax=Bradyrhizobium sp. CSA207 TaxID=2698826 RepID=UPI0023AF50FC|nr:branched-chain amino acid ABC transporter permease [Bradyrhizobium sp. CSA207]
MLTKALQNPFVSTLAVALIVVALPLVVGSNFHIRLATMVYIFSIVVLGLNLLMGYAGQVSLGHAGFFILGAYSVALGPSQLGLNPWLSMAGGVALTSALAFVIGRPLLRLSGYHLAMATLAFGAIVYVFITNEVDLTGGPDGMQVQRANLSVLGLSHLMSWYWLAGGFLVLSMLILSNLLSSPAGRALRALHDSEVAAGVLGIDVARAKLMAFVISAALAALAGANLALLDGHITPAAGGILRSVELLTMAVVGGLGSLVGSVAGAAFLVLLPQFLTEFHDYEHAILGFLLVVIMVMLPLGIVPSLNAVMRRWLP